MKKAVCFLLIIIISCLYSCNLNAGVRIKDIAHVQGVRDNQLLGYGLVVGLNGTGDKSTTSFTFQSVVSMLERLGVTVSKSQISMKNVAAVIVTAKLPPFVREGSRIDCVVSSLGDATSLQGGTLLMTPLQGADGRIYAVAQGTVSIGGFNVGGAAGGMTVQKNHPTVGRIPGGALIEKEVPTDFIKQDILKISLARADFTTCDRIVKAINHRLGREYAWAEDAGMLKVGVPEEYRNNIIGFIAQIEKIEVVPDTIARVVINERTGTIVAGEQVKISRVAVSHGNISIEIKSRYKISQPLPFSETGTTAVVPETETVVEEETARVIVMPEGVNISEVANALNVLGVTPRDMISIFQAIKEAGALQAELVIM